MLFECGESIFPNTGKVSLCDWILHFDTFLCTCSESYKGGDVLGLHGNWSVSWLARVSTRYCKIYRNNSSGGLLPKPIEMDVLPINIWCSDNTIGSHFKWEWVSPVELKDLLLNIPASDCAVILMKSSSHTSSVLQIRIKEK